MPYSIARQLIEPIRVVDLEALVGQLSQVVQVDTFRAVGGSEKDGGALRLGRRRDNRCLGISSRARNDGWMPLLHARRRAQAGKRQPAESESAKGAART